VYQELHALAHRQLNRGPRDGTLSTTTLVHEAYLKLGDHERLELHDRGHFFALAARAMRQIVLDGARRHAADKRGGGLRRIELEDGKIACEERATEILALDGALEKLEALDPRLAAVVELRFYGGLSVEEAAEALGSSPRTIKRDWQKARAFLFRELTPSGSG
jgi:RNA polymerase sigma factor (TIGR02999 family)